MGARFDETIALLRAYSSKLSSIETKQDIVLDKVNALKADQVTRAEFLAQMDEMRSLITAALQIPANRALLRKSEMLPTVQALAATIDSMEAKAET
eukprot:2384727-Prymnesium_polylepis.1